MSKEAMKLALEDYLSREMPAGTVIGDPKWWAAKIANVMTGKAVAEVYKQGYDHGVERQEAIQKLSEIEKQTPASKNQWWAKELEGFWGDSDYRVTLDTRRAAKTALTIIFDTTPQPKQEQGDHFDCGTYVGSHRGKEIKNSIGDEPPERDWVGLTDYEIGVCSTEAAINKNEMVGGAVTFARAIEAKLKEKNT